MQKVKGFNLLEIIIIMIITAIVAGITTGVIMLNNSSDNIGDIVKDKELQEFIDVYNTLLSKYYDNIDKEGMLNAAEEAMVNFLGDKYTTYLDNNEYSDIIDDLAATYDGIGISITNNQIVDIFANSPAEKAGLKVKDVIIKLNGTNVENLSSDEIKNLIKNSKIKTVELEVNRNGEILKFNVTKEALENTTINYKMIENTTIGYLDITKFSENLDVQVKRALSELEGEGMSALIIDVRDNVGGYLSAAEDVASLFLEEGKVIYSLQTSNNTFAYKDETKEKKTYPVVVLTNHTSASASEILAAALKESYNATLVGTTTYGKGKVQQVAELENGDSVKYTSAKWLTPSGKCIDGIGLAPDYNIKNDENNDYQLQKAIELLQ